MSGPSPILATMDDEPIAAFWTWWETGRAKLEAAIDSGEPSEIPEIITGLVHDIHPDLEWQLAPGPSAARSFALSSGGDPSLRLITAQWAALAPENDDDWEYHPARVPTVPVAFEMDGVAINPDLATLTTVEEELVEQLEVILYVPGFERLEPEGQMRVALYLLDAVLGEDDVERWIGFIDTVNEAPAEGRPLAVLPDLVAAFASTATGEGWDVVEEQERNAFPAISTINRALKRLDHLEHTLHLEMVIEMNQWTDLGLPTEDEAKDLNLLEDDLGHTLGGQAVFAARETEECIRRLHYFIRPYEAVEETIDQWAELIESHTIEPVLSYDPDWAIRDRWS